MIQTEYLHTGTTLKRGQYRIDKVLGQGGFGITYLATDLKLERQVAIKEFFPKDYCYRDYMSENVVVKTTEDLNLVNTLKDMFMTEARNIAKLNHPGIIKIHIVFEENGTAYFIMEYIAGRSLSELVRSEGLLSEVQALEYIAKIGNALQYVHDHNMTHLDVKPGNIMLKETNNEPILIDFGLSKCYDAKGRQTDDSPTGVSHGYAPLEQYSGRVSEFSPQTDLYALAATLFFLLTATVPPRAQAIKSYGLTFPDGFSRRCAHAINKAMSADKQNRHVSVNKFLKDVLSDNKAIRSANRQTHRKNQRQSSKKRLITQLLLIVCLIISLFFILR